MSFRTHNLAWLALLFIQPVLLGAQAQRPALIPLSQGTGSSSSQNGAAASAASIGGLTDEPITAGEIVHINVFDAPDFSLTARVSDSGDIPYPILGRFHVGGLDSATAAEGLTKQLRDRNLMLDPEVTVTVDSTNTGITILGEVHSPGIYASPGKHQLSDLIATAGGLTGNSGRIIEITNEQNSGRKLLLTWDPTLHNTENFDRPVLPGDRVLVRACGIAYVGGNVAKPGAYSLCGSRTMTLSEVISLAGGVTANASTNKTYIVRVQADGTRVVEQVDVKKILTSRVADPVVHEDDIIFVSPSPLKAILRSALAFALSVTPTLLYVSRPF